MFVAPTIPDERYEKEQASIAPSASASAGGEPCGSVGLGEGPNPVALGAVHECASPAEVNRGKVRKPGSVDGCSHPLTVIHLATRVSVEAMTLPGSVAMKRIWFPEGLK